MNFASALGAAGTGLAQGYEQGQSQVAAAKLAQAKLLDAQNAQQSLADYRNSQIGLGQGRLSETTANNLVNQGLAGGRLAVGQGNLALGNDTLVDKNYNEGLTHLLTGVGDGSLKDPAAFAKGWDMGHPNSTSKLSDYFSGSQSTPAPPSTQTSTPPPAGVPAPNAPAGVPAPPSMAAAGPTTPNVPRPAPNGSDVPIPNFAPPPPITPPNIPGPLPIAGGAPSPSAGMFPVAARPPAPPATTAIPAATTNAGTPPPQAAPSTEPAPNIAAGAAVTPPPPTMPIVQSSPFGPSATTQKTLTETPFIAPQAQATLAKTLQDTKTAASEQALTDIKASELPATWQAELKQKGTDATKAFMDSYDAFTKQLSSTTNDPTGIHVQQSAVAQWNQANPGHYIFMPGEKLPDGTTQKPYGGTNAEVNAQIVRDQALTAEANMNTSLAPVRQSWLQTYQKAQLANDGRRLSDEETQNAFLRDLDTHKAEMEDERQAWTQSQNDPLAKAQAQHLGSEESRLRLDYDGEKASRAKHLLIQSGIDPTDALTKPMRDEIAAQIKTDDDAMENTLGSLRDNLNAQSSLYATPPNPAASNAGRAAGGLAPLVPSSNDVRSIPLPPGFSTAAPLGRSTQPGRRVPHPNIPPITRRSDVPPPSPQPGIPAPPSAGRTQMYAFNGAGSDLKATFRPPAAKQTASATLAPGVAAILRQHGVNI